MLTAERSRAVQETELTLEKQICLYSKSDFNNCVEQMPDGGAVEPMLSWSCALTCRVDWGSYQKVSVYIYV